MAKATMRRVAVVAPEFPPSTMPPALRLRFVVPYLRQFGWDPIVITLRESAYETVTDPQMAQLLPPDLRIIRTPALPAGLTRRAGFGDLGLRSLPYHWRTLSRLHREGPVDLVFISVPPYFTPVLGRLAWQRFGVPYVLDYQDPWTTTYYSNLPVSRRPGGWKWSVVNGVARILEPRALRHASSLTAVSQATIDAVLEAFPDVPSLPSAQIPLGAEPGDFELLRRSPRPNRFFDRGDNLFHMSYTGRIGVDMVPALRALFGAVRHGLDADPLLFGRLRLHFIGTSYAREGHTTAQVVPLARETGIGILVDEHPDRIPYLDALQVLLDSDAVLALGSELSHYTASKIFPLILAERPILAVFHEASTVNTILRETGAGESVTFGAGQPPESIIPAIHQQLAALLRGENVGHQRRDLAAFEPYTGRAMAERFARVFDSAASAGAQR
jgi:hypothetical protein